MSTALRPLSTSELLDRTFFLYRNNFVVFAGIAAIAEIPVLALRLGNSALIAARMSVWRPAAIVAILVANFIAVAVSHAGTVIAVSDLHLERPSSIRSAYAAAKRSLLRVVWISFVVTVGIPFLIGIPVGIVVALVVGSMGLGDVGGIPIGSFILIGVVAVFVSYWWLARAFVVPVTVIEGTGLRASMDRSKVLTENMRGRILVICILVLVLTWTVTAVFQVPAAATGGLHVTGGRLIANTLSAVILAMGAFAGATLAGPLLTVALTLAYYDARVRKEGFDLQVMMASLAPVPASPHFWPNPPEVWHPPETF